MAPTTAVINLTLTNHPLRLISILRHQRVVTKSNPANPTSWEKVSWYQLQPKSTRAMGSNTPPPLGPTSVVPQSTPIKADTSTVLPFTTNQKYRIESCTAMAEEMRRYLVGPMPADQFLDKFFPINNLLRGLRRVSQFKPGCYSETVKAANEMQVYTPFVSLIKEFPFTSRQLSLPLRSWRRRSSLLASKSLIHPRSPIVTDTQLSHSRSNPISLSTPLTLMPL